MTPLSTRVAGATLADQFSIKHVRQQGARFHVHSWGLCQGRYGQQFATTWCSEPFCEDNLQSILDCLAYGIDPAKVIPSVDAKAWLSSEAGRRALSSSQDSPV